MIKILLIILIVLNNNCGLLSTNKRDKIDYTEIKNNFKTKEEILIESAIKKFNFDINLKTVKLNKVYRRTWNIEDNDDKIYIYFSGKNSENFANELGKGWGRYSEYGIILLNKDALFNFNKDKSIGVIAHEIGHMFGLKHYNQGCNFMLDGYDNCQSYNYSQIGVLKEYIDNNLSDSKKEKYMFNEKEYLKIIDDIKLNKKFTLYLILD